MSKQTDDIYWYGEKTPESVTLRDYFAAAALHVQANQFIDPHKHRELLAQDCYDIADAMIKAREVKP